MNQLIIFLWPWLQQTVKLPEASFGASLELFLSVLRTARRAMNAVGGAMEAFEKGKCLTDDTGPSYEGLYSATVTNIQIAVGSKLFLWTRIVIVHTVIF